MDTGRKDAQFATGEDLVWDMVLEDYRGVSERCDDEFTIHWVVDC
jgi:hypothetical protein